MGIVQVNKRTRKMGSWVNDSVTRVCESEQTRANLCGTLSSKQVEYIVRLSKPFSNNDTILLSNVGLCAGSGGLFCRFTLDVSVKLRRESSQGQSRLTVNKERTGGDCSSMADVGDPKRKLRLGMNRMVSYLEAMERHMPGGFLKASCLDKLLAVLALRRRVVVLVTIRSSCKWMRSSWSSLQFWAHYKFRLTIHAPPGLNLR